MNPPPGGLPLQRPCVRHVRRIMFVCLGNICRSPLAQGVFEHLAERRGVRGALTIASCGTGGWHVGEPPDRRSIAVAEKNGVRLQSRARQLDARADVESFDLLLAMDRKNLSDLLRAGCPRERVGLFLEFAGPKDHAAAAMENYEVPDPYYGGPEGFDHVYALVHAGAAGLLDAIFGEARDGR